MKYLFILLFLVSCTFEIEAADTNTVSSTVVTNSTPPTASAPNLMVNPTICQVPATIGLQSSFVGIATAKGFEDRGCSIRAYSKLLYQYGMKVSAVRLLAFDPAVWDSLYDAGTYAPINNLIGLEAKKEWENNPELIPEGSIVKARLLKEKNETKEFKEVKEGRHNDIKKYVFSGIALLLLL
tara:strand:- start:4738 stop:5283 length:546 start_codon:yes stop_codon:yes gene_type:complete